MLQYLQNYFHQSDGLFFSIPMKAGVLKRLQALLQASQSPMLDPARDFSLPAFDIDLDSMLLDMDGLQQASSFGEAVKHVLFFQIVRASPKRVVRAVVDGELGFSSGDIVIAPHHALVVDGAQRAVVVDSSALGCVNHGDKQPFVLSLHSFSCEELLQIYKWQADDTLVYGLWGHHSGFVSSLAPDTRELLPSILRDLLMHQDGGYVLDQRQSGADQKQACLEALQAVGVVRAGLNDARFPIWFLAEASIPAVKAGYRVASPQHALAIQNEIPLRERSVWELLVILDQDGWEHKVKNTSSNDEPYVPGSGEKLWYSKPGDDTVSFWYLLALAQGEHTIPHWQKSGFYQSLVEGEAMQRRPPRRRPLPIENVDDDAWDLALPLEQSTCRKRQKQLGASTQHPQLHAIEDVAPGDDLDMSLFGPSSDEEHSSQVAGFEPHVPESTSAVVPTLVSSHDAVSAAGPEGPQSPKEISGSPKSGSSSSSSSTGSSSSSSSNDTKSGSSSSSSSSSEAEEAEEPDPSGQPRGSGCAPVPKAAPMPVPIGAGAQGPHSKERAFNPRAGFDYGLGHAVRTYKDGEPIGWEMNCGHPCHTARQCRKNLKETTKSRSAEQTMRLLKWWIIRGMHTQSSDEHMKDVWSELLREASSGYLEEPPDRPPLEYTGVDGQRHTWAGKRSV